VKKLLQENHQVLQTKEKLFKISASSITSMFSTNFLMMVIREETLIVLGFKV